MGLEQRLPLVESGAARDVDETMKRPERASHGKAIVDRSRIGEVGQLEVVLAATLVVERSARHLESAFVVVDGDNRRAGPCEEAARGGADPTATGARDCDDLARESQLVHAWPSLPTNACLGVGA